MSARHRSPKRTVRTRESSLTYGRYEELIESVLAGINRFSTEVEGSVVASLLPSSADNTDYLEFGIEGTVRNSEVFINFIQDEGDFLNHAYFSFSVEPSTRGGHSQGAQLVLNVAKRLPEPKPTQSWLSVNSCLALFALLMLGLAYTFWGK